LPEPQHIAIVYCPSLNILQYVKILFYRPLGVDG
jgi:hypothetical protein